MSDWREGLGLEFIQKVEELLERTVQRRMEAALTELAKCQQMLRDDGIWLLDRKNNLHRLTELVKDPDRNRPYSGIVIYLKDAIKVLQELGDIELPNKKEDNATDNHERSESD